MNILELTDSITLPASAAPLPEGFVLVDPTHAAAFESVHRYEARLHRGRGQFGRELPNQGDAQLAALDERGVATVGAEVTAGMILIGVGEETYQKPTPEELLLRAIFGETAGTIIVTTETVPEGADGKVVESEVVGDEARVVVERQRPLEVGDLLSVDGSIMVVAGIEPRGGIAGARLAGTVEVFKSGSARETLAARSSGPYDPITQLPVAAPLDQHGQRCSLKWLRALSERSAWAAWELVAVHGTQSLGSRAFTDLMQSITPTPPKPPGESTGLLSFFSTPTSRDGLVKVLGTMLEGLGLLVDFDADEIWAGALEDHEIRERSHGQVKSTEIEYGSGDDVVDGLHSQQIFGPRKDNHCACGKYTRIRDTGIVCEECGVMVVQSRMRLSAMAHIELTAPCASPLFDGIEMRVIPVLPPGLRDASIDQLYVDVLHADAAGTGVDEAVEALMVGAPNSIAAKCDDLWSRDFITRPLDFSGVAHVTVCDVSAVDCRLPRDLAKQLFRGHLFGELGEQGHTPKQSRKMIDAASPEALDALDRCANGQLILLESGDRVVARRVELWDHPAIGVDAATLSDLPEVAATVHLPILRESLFELTNSPAFEVVTDGAVPVPAPRSTPKHGWLSDAIGSESLVEAVCTAIVDGLKEPVEDPLLRAALGHKLAPPPHAPFAAFCDKLAAERAMRAGPRPPAEPNLELTLAEAQFPVVLMEKLQALGFETVGDVCERTPADLLKTRQFGVRDLNSINAALDELGLRLRNG